MHQIRSRAALRRFASLSLQERSGAATAAQAALPEGLALRFERIADGFLHWRYRLTLAREHFYPTQDEIEGCSLAFCVPASVVQQRAEGVHIHPKSGRRVRQYVVELIWREQRDREQSHAVASN